eukprot:12901015-Heterocapsa_arctica.AAC.1
MENKQPDKHSEVKENSRAVRYILQEPKTGWRRRACRTIILLTCALHEGKTRTIKSEIHNGDMRAMTYGQFSPTDR